MSSEARKAAARWKIRLRRKRRANLPPAGASLVVGDRAMEMFYGLDDVTGGLRRDHERL